MMIFEESNFVGKDKRPFLAAFMGTIDSLKKQPSGNVLIVLSRSKAEDGENIKREVILKKIEIEENKLEEFLKEGKSIAVYGILTKKKAIFPVCFVKVKVASELRVIEFKDNFMQYKISLDQAQKAQQTELDKWKKK